MNKKKILWLFITIFAVVWIGSIVTSIMGGNFQQASNANNARAESLIDLNAFLPIQFRTAGTDIEPLPTPDIEPIPDIDTLFGVEMYNMTAEGGLYKMDEAGITWIRHNDTKAGPETNALIWTAVEPNQGDRNWGMMSELESQLVNAASLDKKVILIVRSTPRWARDSRWPGAYCGPIDPSHYQDFANFMHDAVKRYSVPPYNVKHWEIYNEPGYPIQEILRYPYGEPHGCWGTWDIEGNTDPYGNGGAYGEMLKVVYPKIKQADPDAQVITGGVLLECDPRGNPSQCELAGHPPSHNDYARFFEGILATGAGDSFDGIGFHSYEFYPDQAENPQFGEYFSKDWNSSWNTTGPVLIAKAQYITSLLKQYNVTGKDLYSTESAVINSDPMFYESGGVCKPFDMEYERTKASHIVQTYSYAKVLGLKSNIYFATQGWRCSALLEGYQNTPVQPAYNAYKFAAHTIGPADFIREVSNYANVRVIEFQKYQSSTKFWVVWSLDGANHSITLPNTPSKIWNMAGAAKSISGNSFNVTLEPHYIQY